MGRSWREEDLRGHADLLSSAAMVAGTKGMATRSPRRALILAALLFAAVEMLVPFGRQILYPFALMGTWVHEMGHGLTAILLGGRFDRLEIFADGSGLAHSFHMPGWQSGLVSIGGLLAPPVVGCVVLALARGGRRGRIILMALAATLLISVGIWVRSAAGLVAMPLVAIALGLVAWRGSGDSNLLVAQLVGILLALDTVTRIDYLFTSTTKLGPSDITGVAEAFGGHYLAWGALLAAESLGLCALGLWLAWRPAKLKAA
jgi:hypothetical protein